ncbi:cytochrome P450 [Rhodococcus sp. NPDC127530]|uniref:cytochrome P450 n=1 Tax=unclassified Rhodococcus (in: high G+C Gram-positive bacteria) TaxID=192944 RepID=UPI00362EB826
MTATIDLENVPTNVPLDRIVDFDIFAPPGIDNGLQESWAELQKSDHSLMWTPRNGGHWIAISGQLLKEVFENHESFSSKCPFLPREAGEQYSFIPTSLDPPEHKPYRKVLNAAVGTASVRRIEGEIQTIAADLIDTLAAKGGCNFTKDFAEIFPIEVFLRLVDLPSTDAARLKYIGDQMTRPDGTMTMAEATDQFFEYLGPFIDERRANPGPDAISAVVQSSVNGKPLSQDECLKICGLLLLAGLDTVVNFLSFMMQHLAENPANRQRLVDNPELIDQATEELLRRYGVVSDARIVNGDTTLDGASLLDGDMVAVPTMLFGIDPKRAGCPMDVDFDRKDTEHLTFGHGVHHCAGSYLARYEITTTLRAWLARIPNFEVVPGEKVRHQSGIVGAVVGLPLQW